MKQHLNSLGADLNESYFFRMFALGCFDSFITLPIAITSLATSIMQEGPLFNFYQGWALIHSDWEPAFFSKSIWSTEKMAVFSVYWDEWIHPFFALVFFALFGLTPEARKGYRRLFRILRRPFGASQRDITEEDLPDFVFKCEGGTDTIVTLDISSRYGLSIPSAR